MPVTTGPAASGTVAPFADAPYRLNADDYYRMIDEGIIPENRRVWLWEGQLYEKMAKTLPHAVAFSKLVTALARVLPPAGASGRRTQSRWPETRCRCPT